MQGTVFKLCQICFPLFRMIFRVSRREDENMAFLRLVRQSATTYSVYGKKETSYTYQVLRLKKEPSGP